MVGVVALGHEVAIEKLVALALAEGLEADAEGLQPVLAGLRQQRDDDARVKPARQQHPDRHVGHHPPLDGGAQRVEHRLGPVLGAMSWRIGRARVRRVPVGPLRAAAVGFDDEHARGRELAHAPQHRVRRGHDRVPAEEMVQRDRVQRLVDLAAGQQRGQRRGEAQPPAAQVGEVQRLDPETVAHEHEATGLDLRDGDREHPLEVLHAVDAPMRVGLADDLRVGLREERVTRGLELVAERAVVVDAAVERDDEAQRRIDHRL